MSTAGVVRISLTADGSNLQAETNAAAGSLDKLGGTATKNSGAFVNFNTHMLMGRHAVSTFAHVTGAATGPLMSLMHVFHLGLGPIGWAIAGFLAVKEAMASSAEAAKKSTEEQKKYFEISMKINELKGIKSVVTGSEKQLLEDAKVKSKQILELNEKIHNNEGIIKEYEKGLNYETEGYTRPHINEHKKIIEGLLADKKRALADLDEIGKLQTKASLGIMDYKNPVNELELLKQKAVQIAEIMNTMKPEDKEFAEWEYGYKRIMEEVKKKQKEVFKMDDIKLPHILTAARGSMLGVLRLEHSASNPQLQEAQKQTMLLTTLVQKTGQQSHFTEQAGL